MGLDDIEKRARNALETLYLLLAGIFHHRFSNWTSDIAIILVGKDSNAVEPFLSRLFSSLTKSLLSDHEDIRRLSLNILVTLVTANNSMEDNFILPYLVKAGYAPIFEDLLQREPIGVTRRDCLSIITLLSLCHDIVSADLLRETGESAGGNPFSSLLCQCESGPFLKTLMNLMEHDFRVALTHRGGEPYSERKGGSLSFASLVGSLFKGVVSSHDINTLAPDELLRAQQSPTECFLTNPGLGFLVFHLLAQHNDFFLKALFFPSTVDVVHSSSRKLPVSVLPEALMDFLELSSYFLPSSEPKGLVYSRLILTTFLVIVENTELCFLLHDEKLMAQLPFRGEKRRPGAVSLAFPATPMPIASYIIEACHMFLRHHLTVDVHLGGELFWICEIYALALDVLHRLLCFQKKMHTRLHYPWKMLWPTLMTFLSSFCASILSTSSFPNTALQTHVFPVIRKALIIYNIAITFGDHFFPSTADYDELFYEIIKCERQFRAIISSIHDIEERSSSNSSRSNSRLDHAADDPTEKKEAHVSEIRERSASPSTSEDDGISEKPSTSTYSVQFSTDLYNITSILDYFTEKMGHFQVANSDTPLSGPLVIDMIKSNYENLRLKLQDDIDQFERYNPESTSEQKLIRRYAKVLIQDLKLKRYTEIEAAIVQRVSSKLQIPAKA